MDFDVASMDNFGSDCLIDKVHIRNGKDSSSPTLGKILCGQFTPEIVTSSGRYMMIDFTASDYSFGGRGFHAQYRTVPSMYCYVSIYNCFALVKELEFLISEFLKPFCTDKFRAVSCEIITPWHIDKNYDVESMLTIYFTFCAEDGGKSCVMNACGGVIENSPSCQVQSPGYPSSFQSSLNCTWLIKAPQPSHKILFEFIELDLDETNSLCEQNSVTLRDGANANAPIIRESFCDLSHNRLRKLVLKSSGTTLNFTNYAI